MTSTGFSRFFAVLASLAAAFEISAVAQTSNAPAIINFSNTAPQAVPRRSSIILVLADGLGYGDLSCYGQTKFQTPNLDKLAADGVRFTNYVVADAGVISRAALLLGKEPQHLRQQANAAVPLAPEEKTVAEILKNAGYHTGWIGEWDLGDENSAGAPWKKGFDEFAGYLDPNDAKNMYADYMFRYAPHSIYDADAKQVKTFFGKETLVPNLDGAKQEYIPDLMAKAVGNFVKKNKPGSRNHYQPFFLVVNYQIPGEGKITVPSDAPYSGESWLPAQKNRAALISRLDGYIGKLREALDGADMTNNAVVFVTSSSLPRKANGIDADFFHSQPGTNDFRVPMIVSWRDWIPAGQASDLQWSAKDFLPTAADIGYAKTPETIDGKSILPQVIARQEKKPQP
jgi:arylsulfatase A-like enzyme